MTLDLPKPVILPSLFNQLVEQAALFGVFAQERIQYAGTQSEPYHLPDLVERVALLDAVFEIYRNVYGESMTLAGRPYCYSLDWDFSHGVAGYSTQEFPSSKSLLLSYYQCFNQEWNGVLPQRILKSLVWIHEEHGDEAAIAFLADSLRYGLFPSRRSAFTALRYFFEIVAEGGSYSDFFDDIVDVTDAASFASVAIGREPGDDELPYAKVSSPLRALLRASEAGVDRLANSSTLDAWLGNLRFVAKLLSVTEVLAAEISELPASETGSLERLLETRVNVSAAINAIQADQPVDHAGVVAAIHKHGGESLVPPAFQGDAGEVLSFLYAPAVVLAWYEGKVDDLGMPSQDVLDEFPELYDLGRIIRGASSDRLEFFTRLLARVPHNEHFQLELAIALDESGRHDEALRTIMNGILINPSSAHCWQSFSVIAGNCGKPGDAILGRGIQQMIEKRKPHTS